jgi:hypothetical protein
VSDEPNRDSGPDAEVLERLFEQLDRGEELEADSGGPEGRVHREYLELLGLMGEAAEPMEPSPAVKERLLAAVTGPVSRAEVVALPAPPVVSTSRRWALRLAASLALALAGFSGYQAVQMSGQRATIDQLARRLEEVEARTPTVASMRDQLAEMRSRLAFVSERGVEICALRPMAAESREANSRGVLYVAADHQHWYLTIDGLVPCKEGRSYQLWFVPEDGEPVSAGTFDVGEGVRVELSSKTMPAATRAVTVTLEPAGGSQAPTGPAVLYGDEVMAVL